MFREKGVWGLDEMSDRSQEVEISSLKLNKSTGRNVDRSQEVESSV